MKPKICRLFLLFVLFSCKEKESDTETILTVQKAQKEIIGVWGMTHLGSTYYDLEGNIVHAEFQPVIANIVPYIFSANTVKLEDLNNTTGPEFPDATYSITAAAGGKVLLTIKLASGSEILYEIASLDKGTMACATEKTNYPYKREGQNNIAPKVITKAYFRKL